MGKNTLSEEVALAKGELLTDAQARNIKSYEQVSALFDELHDAAEAGDGFAILDRKEQLVGKPFVIIDYKFVLGDYGEFVTARIITKSNEKYRVNDGSTGLYRDLRGFYEEGVEGGIVARRGLSVSEYTYKDDDGVETPAKTFYLDTSAVQ